MEKQYKHIRLRVPKACEPVKGGGVIEAGHQAVAVIRSFIERDGLGWDRELFGVVACNAHMQLIGVSVVGIGSATATLVHPREVFRRLIMMGAVAFIAWHTHPSGESTPSREDIELTYRLADSGDIIGIPLLDHLIVSAYDWRPINAHR